MTLLELKVVELEKRLELHRSYGRQLLMNAGQELDRRLETMNEFRAQLTEQAGTFVTKESLELFQTRLNTADQVQDQKLAGVNDHISLIDRGLGDRINKLELLRANLEGRLWMLGSGLVVAGALVQLGLKVLLK